MDGRTYWIILIGCMTGPVPLCVPMPEEFDGSPLTGWIGDAGGGVWAKSIGGVMHR